MSNNFLIYISGHSPRPPSPILPPRNATADFAHVPVRKIAPVPTGTIPPNTAATANSSKGLGSYLTGKYGHVCVRVWALGTSGQKTVIIFFTKFLSAV